jgi:hypothetical protein
MTFHVDSIAVKPIVPSSFINRIASISKPLVLPFFLDLNIMDNHIPIMLIITHISFFFLITTCHSQPPQQPQSVYNYSSCRDINNSYNCGNISNISYPFWGQNRPFYCGAGHPFYLNCHNNNITTILLSSQNFTVLEINTKKYIIKLKRTDIDQNLCSPKFNDSDLFPPLFQYPPSVKNITIYYNCTSTAQNLHINSLCGSQNLAFCHVGSDDENKSMLESYELRNCKRHIQVQVGADFPIENDYYGYIERDVLESGLDKGFEVNYSVKEECLRCLGSDEGDCKWNNSNLQQHAHSSCYYDNCSDGSIAYSSQCSSHHNSKSSISLSS